MGQITTKGQWSDIKVDNWEDLLQELHSSTIIPEQKQEGKHRRSPYVFRGIADESWPLKTSLERLGSSPPDVEHPLLRSFGKYAPTGAVGRPSEWERLAIGQHNGLPTRVLDWTVSPLIAAHFATAEAEHKSCDGAVWCVNAQTVRDRLLPESMRNQLHNVRAIVYNVQLLDANFPTLAAFDASDEKEGDVLIFFEPPSIDQRIHNQFGILSTMNNCAKSHDAFLRKWSQSHPNLVRRIVIKSGAKSGIRDMLDQNNITERMLFPGLPGLCTWLKRYYGPAY